MRYYEKRCQMYEYLNSIFYIFDKNFIAVIKRTGSGGIAVKLYPLQSLDLGSMHLLSHTNNVKSVIYSFLAWRLARKGGNSEYLLVYCVEKNPALSLVLSSEKTTIRQLCSVLMLRTGGAFEQSIPAVMI